MSAGRFFTIFCVLLFGGGALFAILNPPFQVPDEAGHYSRAFELSRGMCFPPATLSMPASYRTDFKTFRGRLETTPLFFSGRILPAEIERFRFFGPHEPGEDGYVDPSENVYACVLYAPAALGLEIVRPLQPTLVASLLFGRLCNVFFCGLLIVAGFRLMPFAKEAYAFVALLPMSLHQLGSVSEDALVNALALFGTAYLLRLAVRRPHRTLSRAAIAGLAGLSVMLGLAKIDIVLLGLLAMIPTARFGSPFRRVAVVVTCFACALATLALAPRLATVSSTALADWVAGENFHRVPNAEFLITHPAAMLTDLIATLHVLGLHYLTEIVGTFGWLSFELPLPFVQFATLVLVVLGVRSVVPARSIAAVRISSIAIACVAFFAVFGSLFITSENLDYLPIAARGWTVVNVMQGRYFLPFIPVAAVAIALRRNRGARLDRFLCVFGSGILLVAGIGTIVESFRLSL